MARPYGLCTDEGVIGTMFYVMDMVEGRILWDQTLPQYEAAERRGIYMAQISTLAALHNTDYEAIGLSDFGRPGNYFARQIDRWTMQYRAAETQHIPEIERLIDWLPKTAPSDGRTTIVHGDYRLDNMVLHATGPRVVAVLDWELSTLGDPLADFSYLLTNWIHGALADLPDPSAHGVPSLDEAVAEYCRLTARERVVDLDWCLSFSFFRIACILQGIAARAASGAAVSPQAAARGARAPMMAKVAWSLALRAGAA